MEWNMKYTQFALKMLISTIYLNILFLIFLITFNYVMIYNYQIYFLINTGIFFLTSISNYVFLYGIRLLLAFFNKVDVKADFINNINKGFIDEQNSHTQNTTYISDNGYTQYETSFTGNTSTVLTDGQNQQKSSILTKLIYYHNYTDAPEIKLSGSLPSDTRTTNKSNNFISAKSLNKSNKT